MLSLRARNSGIGKGLFTGSQGEGWGDIGVVVSSDAKVVLTSALYVGVKVNHELNLAAFRACPHFYESLLIGIREDHCEFAVGEE